MSFLVSIITVLNTIAGWFYTAYVEVKSWVFPFYHLAPPLASISVFFYQLRDFFSTFNTWLTAASQKIASILSWDSVKGLVKSWLPNIESAISWFTSWLSNVNSAINTWWAGVKTTVQGWINTAKTYLKGLIDDLSDSFYTFVDEVQTFINQLPTFTEIITWFKDWWGKILAKIIAWGALTATQIGSLLDSWFKLYAPFWEGWQDVRGTVIGFISNPLDWLADKFTDWFLGPEE